MFSRTERLKRMLSCNTTPSCRHSQAASSWAEIDSRKSAALPPKFPAGRADRPFTERLCKPAGIELMNQRGRQPREAGYLLAEALGGTEASVHHHAVCILFGVPSRTPALK
jgi:hypothetical protein